MTDIESVLLNECVRPGGFMMALREGRIDVPGYERTMSAVRSLKLDSQGPTVSRLAMACVFEVPYEIELCVESYASVSAYDAKTLTGMAEALRKELQDLLWNGFDDLYK